MATGLSDAHFLEARVATEQEKRKQQKEAVAAARARAEQQKQRKQQKRLLRQQELEQTRAALDGETCEAEDLGQLGIGREGGGESADKNDDDDEEEEEEEPRKDGSVDEDTKQLGAENVLQPQVMNAKQRRKLKREAIRRMEQQPREEEDENEEDEHEEDENEDEEGAAEMAEEQREPTEVKSSLGWSVARLQRVHESDDSWMMAQSIAESNVRSLAARGDQRRQRRKKQREPTEAAGGAAAVGFAKDMFRRTESVRMRVCSWTTRPF